MLYMLYHHTCCTYYTCTHTYIHIQWVCMCVGACRGTGGPLTSPPAQPKDSSDRSRRRGGRRAAAQQAPGRASTPASAGPRRGRLGRASPFSAQPASAEFAAPSIRCGSEGGRACSARRPLARSPRRRPPGTSDGRGLHSGGRGDAFKGRSRPAHGRSSACL